jgi:hypothetical protein
MYFYETYPETKLRNGDCSEEEEEEERQTLI